MMLERVDVHTQKAKIRPMHLKPKYTIWNSEISEENMGNTLQVIGSRKDFLKRTSFAQKLRQTIKLDFIN